MFDDRAAPVADQAAGLLGRGGAAVTSWGGAITSDGCLANAVRRVLRTDSPNADRARVKLESRSALRSPTRVTRHSRVRCVVSVRSQPTISAPVGSSYTAPGSSQNPSQALPPGWVSSRSLSSLRHGLAAPSSAGGTVIW